MDVESFSQCLQYISVTNSELSAGKLIPIASALIGAIIGFILNFITSLMKDSKATKNKVMCCEEDVERIRAHTIRIIKALCRMSLTVAASKRITHHTVAPSISSLCLSEYFIGVAHKFNKSQRESIQKLIINIELLNKKIPSLSDPTPENPYTYSIALLNCAYAGCTILGECEDFKRKEITNYEENEVLSWIGASPEEIQTLIKLKQNAEEGNTVMRLHKFVD